MRWQKVLRIVIAIGGLGFAGLLYTRYEKKPEVAPAPLPPRMAAGASFQSVMSPGGEQIRYQGEKEILRFGYTKLLQFEGHQSVEGPKFVGDRDGKPYTITALKAELVAPGGGNPNDVPEETHLIGSVVIRENDGMEIKTEDAFYRASTGTLEMAGAMTFSDGRTTGSGVGATYDRGQQLLTIRDQAVIKMAADESGQGRFDAQARTMTINRVVHFVSLDGNPTITRDHEVINAETAAMHLNDDNHGIQLMELRQHAGIVPVAGAGQTPEMHGDDINLEFQPDGRTIKRSTLMRNASLVMSGNTGRKQISGSQLDVQLGKDGQTVTSLSTDPNGVSVSLPASGDTPKRDITAKQLIASGDGNEKNGLTSAVFDKTVVFLETQTVNKTERRKKVLANQLTLALVGGDFSDIKDARFKGNVQFQDGVKYGEADDITYLAKEGKLKMRPTGTNRVMMRTDKIYVTAKTIDIALDQTAITALGEIRTQTFPDTTKAGKGLFDESKITIGIANDRLEYDGDKGDAIYFGGVQLRQGNGKDETRISADEVRLNDVRGDIVATGKVTTVFPIANMQASGSSGSQSTAAKFEYIDAEHRARYTGSGVGAGRVNMNSADGKILAGVVELMLSADGHELKQLLASSDVQARVSADRTVIGARMKQDTKTGLYELSGSPAKVVLRTVDKGAESCSITVGSAMTFTKTENAKDQGTYTISDPVGAGSYSQKASNCAEWIIK